MTHSLYIDGGARGNPGPGAIGVVLENEDGEVIYELSKYIGECTNNDAEYTALWTGLQIAVNREIKNVEVFTDSELVAKQVRGEYKVKNDRLRKMHGRVKSLVSNFDQISFTHIKRSANKKADALVNKALNNNGF
jgi:ribonuclease HI